MTPYTWYFDPRTYGISTPYAWYFDPPAYLLIRNEWGQNTIQGGGQFSIIDLGANLPWGSKYHMTPGANPRRIGDRLV